MNKKKSIKKSNGGLLSKENVNVLNTPVWTSPKRNSSRNNNNSSKLNEENNGPSSKHIENSLFDLNEMISQRMKELSSIRSKSRNDNFTLSNKSAEKTSSGNKSVKVLRKENEVLTPSESKNDYAPIISSNSTPDSLLFPSTTETSPNDSPLMVKISRFALNDLHNREKVISQQLKEANYRISYLEGCSKDKDIHIESLNIALEEMQTIHAEMEIDAASKHLEVTSLKTQLKSRNDIYHHLNEEVNVSSAANQEIEAQLANFQRQVEELKEKAKNNEDLQKKCSRLEAKLAAFSDYDELCEKVVNSQNTIDGYKSREKELKDLFDGTTVKVDELKAKADHYHKVSKDYKKKIKYFENEIISYEKSLAEAEAKIKESANKVLEMESIRMQEKEKFENEDILLSETKTKETEYLLFKGLYEEAVQENERWVLKVKQQEEAIQIVEAEKNMLEGTVFDLEVSVAKLEKDLEEAYSAKAELVNKNVTLDKAKKKIKDLKAGLVTIANAHDDSNTANSSLLSQIISLQETIDIKEEEINNLTYQLNMSIGREEELAQGFLLREEELKDLEVSLRKAEERVEVLQDELDLILMEKLSSSANSSNKNTPSITPSSFSAPNDFSSPNPFATPYNKVDNSNPNTNDDNGTNIDRYTAHPDDQEDIDETLALVNEAEDAFKAGNLYLSVEKYKQAGLKGIQSIKNDEATDIETKRQLKELVKICLTNAESINNKIGIGNNNDDDTNESLSSKTSLKNVDSQKIESKSELDWVDSLIRITIIGTIIMVAIFFALIAHFEMTRPPMGPKYIWSEDV